MTIRYGSGLRTAALAAALALGGVLTGTGAEAAPLASPPVEAVAGEAAATQVQWGHRHRHWGHHHHHRRWGHRHRHWGHHHHHHHRHHHRRHRHFY